MTSTHLRLFLRLSAPIYLLSGIILYVLGAGIANFLGESLRWDVFWLGMIWVVSLQVSGHFLNSYFATVPAVGVEYKSAFRGFPGLIGPEKLHRPLILWSAYISLALTASLSVLLISSAQITPVTLLVMVLLLVGVFLFAVPPLRQVAFSYRELVVTIWMASLLPSFGFLLHVGQFHRLIAMITFPLAAVHLAMVLVFSLEDFAVDNKYEIPSFLERIGWNDGMNLHNILIVGAYVLFGIAIVFGMPLPIALPALATLPLGGYHVWNMQKIAQGGKPNWRSMEISAVALFLALSYLATYGFWTR